MKKLNQKRTNGTIGTISKVVMLGFFFIIQIALWVPSSFYLDFGFFASGF